MPTYCICSGDGDGKAYIWDWKTTKLLSKWKAHDDVCIQVTLPLTQPTPIVHHLT